MTLSSENKSTTWNFRDKNIKKTGGAGDLALLAECPPSRHEARGSIPSTPPHQKKKNVWKTSVNSTPRNEIPSQIIQPFRSS